MGSCIMIKHMLKMWRKDFYQVFNAGWFCSIQRSLNSVGLSSSSLSFECYYYKFKCNNQKV